MGKCPRLSGKELMRLLRKDGWTAGRHANHGVSFSKKFPGGRTRVTVIPNTTKPLPTGTLRAILGPKQTNIGVKGLQALVDKYG